MSIDSSTSFGTSSVEYADSGLIALPFSLSHVLSNIELFLASAKIFSASFNRTRVSLPLTASVQVLLRALRHASSMYLSSISSSNSTPTSPSLPKPSKAIASRWSSKVNRCR